MAVAVAAICESTGAVALESSLARERGEEGADTDHLNGKASRAGHHRYYICQSYYAKATMPKSPSTPPPTPTTYTHTHSLTHTHTHDTHADVTLTLPPMLL